MHSSRSADTLCKSHMNVVMATILLKYQIYKNADVAIEAKFHGNKFQLF